MKINYYGLSRKSDVVIQGSTDWFLQHKSEVYDEQMRWPKWKSSIDSKIIDIKYFDFDSRKNERLLSIDFFYKSPEHVECVKNDLVDAIGLDVMKRSFHLFEMSMEGKLVKNWICFLVRSCAAVRYFEPSEIKEELPVYGSLYFPLIVSEEIYNKVKHVKVLESKWKKLDFYSPKDAIWKMRVTV